MKNASKLKLIFLVLVKTYSVSSDQEVYSLSSQSFIRQSRLCYIKTMHTIQESAPYLAR